MVTSPLKSRRQTPVFYDARGRRGPVFRVLTISAACALVAILAGLTISLARPASLPSLRFAIERTLTASFLPFNLHGPSPALNFAHARASSAQGAKVPRLAFYNGWDENSFYSLRLNAQSLDVLLPEWLHTTGSSGAIAHDDSRTESETRLWVQKNASHLQIMPVINNYDPGSDSWDGTAVDLLLASEANTKALIENIAGVLEKKKDEGVVVDFKLISDDSLKAYVSFLSDLRAALKPAGRKVMVVAPAYEHRFDLWKLSQAADNVIIVGYDQHWEGGAEGPLGAQGWFEAVLDRAFATNTGTKFIVAVGSYAVDWQRDGTARRISVSEAWDTLQESGAQLHFDPNSLNPTFGYRSDAHHHQVWFLDGVTGYNQIAAALAMKPGGLALWRLGTEDPTIWSSFARGRVAEEANLKALQTIEPSQAIVHKGEGEVLSISDRTSQGRREIDFKEEYNLITDQELKELPKSLSLHHWGHNEKKLLALTFDDGPSNLYTPKILDILKEKNVKATFFVVGANATLESGLLRRVYAEGHDIGNRTFTHPNLSSIGATLLDLELNATQRVLEAKLGVGTRLFRPPFNKDANPVTKDEARTLINSAALGYITIGMKIDPLDWARPGVDEIVRRTVSYAEARRGNVILLHDAGGDRRQTIEALPLIIDRLEEKGFKFVAVHELLGLKRHEVMPPIQNSAGYEVAVNNAGFTLFSASSSLVGILFVVSIALGVGRLLLVSLGAVAQSRRVKSRADKAWQPQSLAILVPAYNEEKVIVDSVQALLNLDCDIAEIIVVDDGSTDRTLQVAQEAFVDNPRVRVVTKDNGGKASALNLALQLTDAEVVIAIDADTRLDKQAVFWLARHFEDPAVGAVAGTVDVGNRQHLITQFQEIEYIVSQNLDRRALEMANGIVVVPGALGAWRRQAVMDVGGYDDDTLAEDADLTLKLQRAGWRILTEPKALAVTEAPQTTRLFLRQRFRWMFGMLQVAWKHSSALKERGAKGVKYIALPNIVLFQFLFALVAPFVDLLMVSSLAIDAYNYFLSTADGLSSRTQTLMLYWAVWQALEFAVAALAFTLDKRNIPSSLLPLLIAQRFCYRQLLYYVAIKTLVAAIRGRLIGWDKLPRRGIEASRAVTG